MLSVTMMVQVVVPVAQVACRAQLQSVDKAGVYQFVGQYQRVSVRHGGQDACVGVVAAVEHQGGFFAVEACQFRFQFLVDGEVARQ